MVDNFYWLISITLDSARVSLISNHVVSQGQEIVWDPSDSESLLKAVDTSLSSQNNDTTSDCAFIVPPNWIGEDGKIFPEMLKNLKYICTKLKLHPTGFISHDDAFVESYNSDDSFPSSFILVYFSNSHYQASLVYLGQIKKRFISEINGGFSVSQFEQSLSNLEFPSALPPKIVVIGTFTSEIIEDLKTYNWLARKDIETFLHLPDVVSFDILSLDQIFIETIKKQIAPSPVVIPETVPDTDQILQVTPDLLGFTIDDVPDSLPVVPDKPSKPKIKFSFPQISFPKINFSYYWLLPLTLLPFLPVLPLYFSKVNLTIYQNPVDFKETFKVTLDPNTNVSSKTFSLSVGASLPTTGKKEVGNKSKGEIIIFNKLDRSVNINKGLIVSDSSGKKFETTNNILLPGSTYNLDTGTISMGQVKAAVAALNIGPEYNLAPNLTLTIKDNPNILAKSSTPFSGGTRDEISVVTQADKNKLQNIAKGLLKDQAINEINSQKSGDNSILESTMLFDNQKLTYNREVGEDSELLTLDLSAKVSFLYFSLSQKQKMISDLFPQKNSLSSLDKNSATVSLNFTSPDQLTLAGQANPFVDIEKLKSKLTGKRESDLKSILNTLPRYYQHSISNSLSLINLFRFLPVKPNLINIIIKN